jgi:hypothetical protein
MSFYQPVAPAGSNTQIQFNDNGGFGGSADLTWDDTGKELGVGGDINLDNGGTYSTKLQIVTPTANRTISFPDTTGTVVTTGDGGTVTSTMIADGTIVNADINSSAAIAGTKIDPDFGSQSVLTTGTIDAGSLASLANLMFAFATRGASIGEPGKLLFGVGPAVTGTTPVGIGPHDYYPIDLPSGSFM